MLQSQALSRTLWWIVSILCFFPIAVTLALFPHSPGDLDASRKMKNYDAVRTIIQLDSAIERDLLARQEPPISTLTWFQGDHRSVTDLLRQRIHAMIQQNPWMMTGQIVRSPFFVNKPPLLVYFDPNKVEGVDLDGIVLHVDPEDSPISYSPTTAATAIKYQYLATRRYTNITDEHDHQSPGPLMRVTVVPCRKQPMDYFAVILSVSHAVVDITSFYALHGMLLSEPHLHLPQRGQQDFPRSWSLDMTPLVEDEDAWARRALGEDAFSLQHNRVAISVKGLFSLVGRFFIRNRSGTDFCFLVDNDAMNEEKQKHGSLGPTDSNATVSTNDVLTSWFFSTCKCAIGLLCVDFQRRISQAQQRQNRHTSTIMKGRNHWGVIVYQPEDVQYPWQIRQSLRTMRRTISGNLPNAWHFATRGSVGIATSWIHQTSWQLPNCQTLTHLPLYDFATYCPSGFCVMRTFTPTPGRTGVYIAGDARMVAKLFENRPPFCDQETLTCF